MMTVHMNIEAAPASWTYWPEHEDLSVELSRLLSAAQDGGSTVAECLLAAGRIRVGDEDSWHREWRGIADSNGVRGDAAFGGGNHVTARSNWLRAINYYQASVFSLADDDLRQQAALPKMRECASKYLRCRDPAGEVVTIPWLKDHLLEGYFLPARSGPGRAPTVICVGEPACRKEQLFGLERHARDRGLSLLLIDLMGKETGGGLKNVIGQADPESAISRAMDYVCGRDDVDERRVAVLAHECASSFVARGVANDPRFAATVCDGGIWDLHERAFLASRVAAVNADFVPDAEASRVVRNIRSPPLITLGEQGWLKAARVTEIVDRMKVRHPDVTLRIFKSSETASQQGHVDNSTLACEFVFDWIANRLGAEVAQSEPLKAIAL
jgi:hypothetical protein